MLTRRRFVTIGAIAGLGAVTGCSRSGSTSSPKRSVPSLDGRRADVVVRYTMVILVIAVVVYFAEGMQA